MGVVAEQGAIVATGAIAPMEALSVEKIPEGNEWQYEPKWDGFRCVARRDGDDVQLWSKAGQPLARYFPEVVQALLKLKAMRFVLDGELVIPVEDSLSFDDLLMRLHPAESRIKKLSVATPALFVVFDFLEDEKGEDLRGETLEKRRKELERFAAKYFKSPDEIRLSPATRDVRQAKSWLRSAGGALDGVIAKRIDMDYRSGLRDGMQKIKLLRTADCVVGGFRYATGKKVVGSLLLGLYDDAGVLHHVGFTSGLKAAEKPALTAKLEKLKGGSGFTGRAPGGPSRWSTERSGEWEPLKPVLVAEVGFDHVSGGRFRHGTRFLRWRPDKNPEECTLEQMENKAAKSPLALMG